MRTPSTTWPPTNWATVILGSRRTSSRIRCSKRSAVYQCAGVASRAVHFATSAVASHLGSPFSENAACGLSQAWALITEMTMLIRASG